MDEIKEALKDLTQKFDKMDEKLDNMAIVHAKNTVVLETHEKRSTTAELNLDLLRKEFKPIQRWAHKVQGALKFISFIGAGILIKIAHSFFSK